MKKSLESFIALNRKRLLLLGVMLSLAVFSFITWQVTAQIKRSGRRVVETTDGTDLSGLSDFKIKRILADEQSNGQSAIAEIDRVPSFEPPLYDEAPNGLPACGNTIVYAYNFFNDHLISFNPQTPGTLLTDIPVVGLNAANNEFLESLDFRPANGQLYAVATDLVTSRVVTINTMTGEIMSVGGTVPAPVSPLLIGFFGGDFNPVPDRIRETSDINSNRRLNPNDGTLSGTDTNLAYAAGDPGFGVTPAIVQVAYSNNTAGVTSTTLFGIDSNRDTLVTIGSPGGTPISPNTGQVFTVGPLGVNATLFGAFDIQQGTGVAYAALRVTSISGLYRINLATGAATLVGAIGNGTNQIDGLSLAIGPTAACADLAITKTDGVSTYTPGGTTTYTIVATNTGPDPVVAATVSDTFPAQITSANWTCVGAGGGVCPAANGSGNINASVNLPVGGSVTFTVTANISPGATGNLVNTATVTTPAGVTDSNPGNNSATDTDTRIPLADLSITKTDGTTVVTAGGMTTYTIVASNNGPDAVIGATVVDNFPNTITSVTWTCVGAGGGTCLVPNGSGNILLAVNLPVGGTVTFTAVAQISPSATFGMSNTASIAHPNFTDPVPGNNSATDVDNICSGTTFSYSGAPVPIADAADLSGLNPGAPANATLNVSGVGGPINDINLSIDGTVCSTTAGSTTVGIDHTFVNDLEITLISPGGTSVLVINNTDGSGNNFCQVVLDDESAGPSIQTALTAQAPFTGSWKPNVLLSAFDGQNPNGTWTLRAQDFFSGDIGSIRAWSLSITACPTTAAGVSVSGRVLTPDGRGLRNARVVITDSQGVARTVTTSSFGFYQFDDVAVGESYVIGVVSKLYRFQSQIIQVNDTLTNVNFVGLE